MSDARRYLTLFLSSCFVIGAAGKCHQDQPPAHVWTIDEVKESAVLLRPVELKSDPRFALRKVLRQILQTSGAQDSAAAEDALLQSLLSSLNAQEFSNPVSGLRMRVDARPNEATLKGLADELVPVGLFNRIDVMSGDASDCGEYRIAYSSPSWFFLVIFEARMPNTGGVAACGKIARYWQKLEAMNVQGRLDALAKFYFDGVEGFPAAVRAEHYGAKLGQVRSNSFVNSPWMLREWKIEPRPGTPAFQPNPLGSPTPLTEFYSNGDAGSLDPQLQAKERQAFQDAFASKHADELVSINAKNPNLPGATIEQVIVSTMGAAIPQRFQEFQSDASGVSDIPVAGSNLAARLKSSSGQAPQVVDKAQLMNRAGAITCGGCHGFSGNSQVSIGTVNGTELKWPSATQFRHIGPGPDTDAGQNMISTALRNLFIPYRRANLVKFLNDTEGAQPIATTQSGPDEATPALSRHRHGSTRESVVL